MPDGKSAYRYAFLALKTGNLKVVMHTVKLLSHKGRGVIFCSHAITDRHATINPRFDTKASRPSGGTTRVNSMTGTLRCIVITLCEG